jgi:hypothetical protein
LGGGRVFCRGGRGLLGLGPFGLGWVRGLWLGLGLAEVLPSAPNPAPTPPQPHTNPRALRRT